MAGATAASVTGERPAAPLPPFSPGRRLWLKFLRAKGGKPGLAMICLFAGIAFLAPFLAHRLPFYWHDAETGTTSYPLIREFFAPDTTEPFLETGINFLFLFIPLALAAWKAMNAWFPRLGRTESKAVSLLFGALVSAALWFGLGGMIFQACGGDWLRYENPPVPESDDIDDLSAFHAAGVAESRLQAAARAAVDSRLADAAGGRKSLADGRALLAAIQGAIDGPAMAMISEMASLGAVETRGMGDRDLELGLNAARWNRILVETAYPGLLTPFIHHRTAFLLLAAACFLVLVGLTFVFMTGANQFSLTPRCLVILALAVVVCLPFGGMAKNDQTPYRQLAAEGKGTGLFPLIPYGQNEQGFGPLLPPDWHIAAPTLSGDDIISWTRLAALLEKPDSPAARHVADRIGELSPPGTAPPLRDRNQAAALLNRLIENGVLYDSTAFAAVRVDISLSPYLSAIRDGVPLAGVDVARFNRLLLERALPSTITGAMASRWKKPRHLPGSHLLGTDESGRDVLTRIIHGARVSLSVGFVSVALATVIGLVMGSLAAYYGGWVDMTISRFMEIMMCFPSFFLILAVIAVLDRRSILNIMLVIGLTGWTGVARLIRGEMLKHKKMDYVAASIALGASDARTIFRHILPNSMAPVLVSISFGITGAILTEAGLSFIGFGVTPPTPTWGQLLSETRDSPLANWWLALFPGIVLFLGVFAYNLAGEALRDALDPRTSV